MSPSWASNKFSHYNKTEINNITILDIFARKKILNKTFYHLSHHVGDFDGRFVPQLVGYTKVHFHTFIPKN